VIFVVSFPLKEK